MLYEPAPYRWQDHVITPRRAAADLMATAAVFLTFGAALTFACVHGPADPPDPPMARAAVSEHTPPLCQLVKRPEVSPHGPKLHLL
jgi:hypothetical protein